MNYRKRNKNTVKYQDRPCLREMQGGCSALFWQAADGSHLWGRNFDLNRIAGDSGVTYLPEGTVFYTEGTEVEKNLDPDSRAEARYAALGMGSLAMQSTPVLYEGINEKGLAGGQLYYRELASFPQAAREGTLALQPAFAVTYLLTQCKNTEEVVRCLEERVTLVAMPILGNVPSVHWMFSDRSGESVVIEPDADGLHIYRNSMGILTNSPDYPWHCRNLLNYAGIRSREYGERTVNGLPLCPCFSGSGAQGLPGDFSSTSRFIRLAFLKEFGVPGKDEEEGAAFTFRLLQNVAFPLGMVKVGNTGEETGYDAAEGEYDYTIYTAVMCPESLKYRWTSYRRMEAECIDMNNLSGITEVRQIRTFC